MNQIRKRLTYANVMSSLAVFLVLGGGAAFAAVNLPGNSVGTKQLKKNAVKTGKVSFEAIRAGKLSKNAVPTNRLRDQAVATDKIADLGVTTGKLGDLAVTTGKLGDKAVTTGKLGDKAVTTEKIGDDQVTGSKVKESTLGTVPSASNAAALGGTAASGYAKRMFARVSYDAGGTSLIAASPGIVALAEAGEGFPRLSFPQSMNSCAVVASAASGAGTQIVRRSTSVSGSTVQFAINDDEDTNVRSDFDVIAVC